MVNRVSVALLALLVFTSCRHSAPNSKAFSVRGVVIELKSDGKTVIVDHEEIPDYMDAMTMPFRAKDTNQLAKLQPGDQINFQLFVTEEQSWIGHVTKTGRRVALTNSISAAARVAPPPSPPEHPLVDYAFTNQLGQPVTLGSFRGQALAITFFFTRCPIPDYCPRLSKNFEEASNKLASMPDAPRNWHFLSVTIDPQFDTPEVLRAYARRYDHDPKRWSFLTGPVDKITELARESGVTFKPDSGLFDHNFRTLIIDPTGKLQMSFPIGGNISDGIVGEVIKAAGTRKSG
jgi:protein SCO1